MADNFNFEFVIKIGNSAPATSSWKNTIAVITIIIFTVRLWAKSSRGRGKNRLFPGFIFHYSHAKTKTKTNNITPYCAVCLYEATDGERLRQLPGCNHCFHVECVDAWLEYRPTCPLCRSQVSLHQNHQYGFFQFCRICVGKWGII